MRILEITLALLLAGRTLIGLKWRDRWVDWLSVCILGILLMHLGLEGYRWQMLLVYTLALGSAFLAIIRLVRHRPIRKTSPIWGVLTLGLLIIATLIPVLVPVPRANEPTGPYEIGTVTVMLVDESREELYSGVPGEPRRLVVQVWYPADAVADTGETVPWIENVEVMAPELARFLGFPDFALDHLGYVLGHAYPEVPISTAQEIFPVLVFSHGWSGFRAQNTFQVEELVSHGYVVAAPNHTYGAIASVFPDGEVALLNRDALPMRGTLPYDDRMEAVRTLGDQWARDISFILDSLIAAVSEDGLSMFAGRIDPERVGAFGHSTGGGAAIQFCGVDPRCKVALGMDPYMEPVAQNVLESGLDVPLMGMFSEGRSTRSGANLDLFGLLQMNSTGGVIRFEIAETAHFDFSDLPALSPLAHAFGLKGKIDGDLALRLINDYTLAFFGHEFMGIESDLLGGPSELYPEVIWK